MLGEIPGLWNAYTCISKSLAFHPAHLLQLRYYGRKAELRAGEVAQQLDQLLLSFVDWGADPSTHISKLTNTSNPSSKGPCGFPVYWRKKISFGFRERPYLKGIDRVVEEGTNKLFWPPHICSVCVSTQVCISLTHR